MKKLHFLPISLVALFFACTNPSKQTEKAELTAIYVEGEAQGTTYHIKYIDSNQTNYKTAFDSILLAIDQSVSTYLPTSLISQLNNKKDTIILDDIFKAVYLKSIEIGENTAYAFDVTLAPVINAYGWGFKNKSTITPQLIDSLLELVGVSNFKLSGDTLIKLLPNAMLDFNAIAQGYSADLLADFLEQHNIQDYMVEMGGEVKTKGKNVEGEWWRLGVDKPIENAESRKLSAILSLENEALATSGNYRKFYVESGVKYSHTINPKTGYPVDHSLLSASVVSKTGMEADAYATVFMVLGLEKAKVILETNPTLDAFLIYADSTGQFKTFITPRLEQKITLVND